MTRTKDLKSRSGSKVEVKNTVLQKFLTVKRLVNPVTFGERNCNTLIDEIFRRSKRSRYE